MNVKLVKLHEYKELIDATFEILNNQWPRSNVSRLRSLTDSRDDFPCCLLLIEYDSHHPPAVVGHSKLTKVHGKATSLFIENVVVHKEKRGLGYGRKLMELCEDYAFKLHYETMYLNTHDKCKFYEHLGYQYTSPVSAVRANASLLSPAQFAALQSHFGEKDVNIFSDGRNCKEKSCIGLTSKDEEFASQTHPSLPYLPPPDASHLAPAPTATVALTQSNPTPVPSVTGSPDPASSTSTAPPPPAPPPPSLSLKKVNTRPQEIQYWMFKPISSRR